MKLPAPGSIIVLSNKSNNKVDYKVIFKNESQNEKMKLKDRASLIMDLDKSGTRFM